MEKVVRRAHEPPTSCRRGGALRGRGMR